MKTPVIKLGYIVKDIENESFQEKIKCAKIFCTDTSNKLYNTKIEFIDYPVKNTPDKFNEVRSLDDIKDAVEFFVKNEVKGFVIVPPVLQAVEENHAIVDYLYNYTYKEKGILIYNVDDALESINGQLRFPRMFTNKIKLGKKLGEITFEYLKKNNILTGNSLNYKVILLTSRANHGIHQRFLGCRERLLELFEEKDIKINFKTLFLELDFSNYNYDYKCANFLKAFFCFIDDNPEINSFKNILFISPTDDVALGCLKSNFNFYEKTFYTISIDGTKQIIDIINDKNNPLNKNILATIQTSVEIRGNLVFQILVSAIQNDEYWQYDIMLKKNDKDIRNAYDVGDGNILMRSDF
jgi:hypothetical protein